jgi:proteasome lid subunit RPN8/RPN11
MALHLTEDQVEEMIRHAQREYPNEACGLLAGRDSRVAKVYQMTNAEHSPATYRLDPEEQFRAFMEIEEAGWELLAIYHSHSHSSAYPSATDLELAFYPDPLYLIISLADRDQPTIRAFRIAEGVVEDERMETTLSEEA